MIPTVRIVARIAWPSAFLAPRHLHDIAPCRPDSARYALKPASGVQGNAGLIGKTTAASAPIAAVSVQPSATPSLVLPGYRVCETGKSAP